MRETDKLATHLDNGREMAVVVKEVQIKGNHRTHRSFFNNELRTALSRETFPDLHSSLVDMTKRMESFGLFSSVETVIKVQPSGMTNVVIPVSIVIEVKEKQVLSSKVSSSHFLFHALKDRELLRKRRNCSWSLSARHSPKSHWLW